ncbi:hypothetical protein BDZ94DRAFT_790384 [Collybia nuda]|uniref:Uncharacterized protein n=1 Tax=Collybia nuda TaxID=64659 RepID=A0A9P6CH23_9AGAR|nr:hypothetical protein BDZ94DRAFT_790384 [Collybia nuda]
MSQPLYYICGLLILAEHLSVVWSGKSVSSEDIPPTVTLYQEVSCDKVKHGVDKILSGCNGHVPVPFGLKLNAEQEEFLSKLSSLVLENRLDKAQLLAWP